MARLLTEAMASCRLGLGFLLAEEPKILFIASLQARVTEGTKWGTTGNSETARTRELEVLGQVASDASIR